MDTQVLKEEDVSDGVSTGVLETATLSSCTTPISLNDLPIIGVVKPIVKSPKMQKTPTSTSTNSSNSSNSSNNSTPDVQSGQKKSTRPSCSF